MTTSRLRGGRSRDAKAVPRARLGRPLMLLLIALRWYALIAVAVAIYAFFHALPR
jgi:hypothetical protein